jgi:nicotinamidase-related amidase
MTAPRRVLIVIDAQQEYFTGLLPIQYPPREESIQRMVAAVEAAEQAGIPVVMVQHSAGEDAPVFNPGKEEWQLHPSLEERRSSDWKSVVKQYSSAFSGTGLAEWLRENGVDTVTLAGYMTNNCIIASASDTEIHGFTAEVLSDATGAIDISNSAGTVDAKTVHTTLLALLNSNFAAVVTTDHWSQAVQAGVPLEKSSLIESAAGGTGL